MNAENPRGGSGGGRGGNRNQAGNRNSGGGRSPGGGRTPGPAARQPNAPLTPAVQKETAPVAAPVPAAAESPAVKTRHKNLLFQKVAIFIDAENIETSGLKHHEGRTDYKKIIELVGDREIIRILYYKPIYKEISPEFEAFWGSMGGEIRRPSKNADTFLVIDAVTMAEKIDVAIILGGDKDFLPLIWYLRSRGCRVEIWSWPETTSPEMQSASDYYQPLTEEFVISLKSRRGASK